MKFNLLDQSGVAEDILKLILTRVSKKPIDKINSKQG